MRILVVHPGPDFSVHDVHTGWVEAFRELGCEAVGYNLNDRLIFYSTALRDTGETDEEGHPIVRNYLSQDAAYRMAAQGLSHAALALWPDAIFYISAFFLTAGTFALFRQRNFKQIIMHTESPYQDREQLIRGQLADLNLINDPSNLEKFREITPAEYVPHSYRPSVHHPGPVTDPGLVSDLAFIGTAFKSRVEFFEAMDLDGLDVIIGGSDWGSIDPGSPVAKFVGSGIGNPDCIDNEQTAELYRHAKCGINFYRRETAESEEWDGIGWSMGPREVEMAASGLFFIRDPRPESDELLGMLPAFDSPQDASEKLRWWLAHDKEREKAATRARTAIQCRTFTNSAKRVLGLIENL